MIDRSRNWMAGAVLLTAVAACSPEPGIEGEPHAATGVAANGQLPADVLARLEAEYPRLGEAPLPEPQPNGDPASQQVPERLQAALPADVLETVSGEATFYADKFEGRRTASGIPFRQNQMVAAHKAYPFGTILRVTNTRNNRSVNVRVVDRGPFGTAAQARRTVVDLSTRAAGQLGFIDAGRTPVRVEVLEWGRGVGSV
jgi:rare lipoprotein A